MYLKKMKHFSILKFKSKWRLHFCIVYHAKGSFGEVLLSQVQVRTEDESLMSHLLDILQEYYVLRINRAFNTLAVKTKNTLLWIRGVIHVLSHAYFCNYLFFNISCNYNFGKYVLFKLQLWNARTATLWSYSLTLMRPTFNFRFIKYQETQIKMKKALTTKISDGLWTKHIDDALCFQLSNIITCIHSFPFW